MNIENKDLNLDNIIEDTEKSFLKLRSNGLYLSDNQIAILDMYNIEYQKCSDTKQLIYLIDDYLSEEESDNLEQVLEEIAEYDYYNNTNK